MIYGIDIGGTKIELSVFNEQLVLIETCRVPTPSKDYTPFINTLADLVSDADAKHGTDSLVGLGMAGLIDAKSRSLSANVPAANGENVAADLENRVGRAVTCENDCRCFALSEAVGGAGDGYHTVYGAIIGTGAAGGFTIGGELLKSRQGIAGEYGHIPLPASLQQKYGLRIRACGCGLRGCIEGFISGPGLVQLHSHFGGIYTDVPTIIEAWRNADVVAQKTMNCYLDLLGASFATIVMSYDPEILVLGGGISLVDEIVDQVPENIENHLFKNFTAPPVARAKFGDASGARGAAILARQHANG